MTLLLAERLHTQEYLALESDYPYIRELLDGEIILSGSPKPIHNRTVMTTFQYLQPITPNGTWMIAPMDLELSDNDVLQPDLFWASEGGQCVELPNRFKGAPDLIIEVLSPSTAKRDKGYKFQLYARAGVKEYWILDPELALVEAWYLDNERYVLIDVADKDDTFTSKVLDKPIEVKALF